MVHLDYRASRPIYTQITDGFTEQISTGVLQSGDKLPSVRELAAELAEKLAKAHGCTVAILKAKSPSCGGRQVYDGSFSRNLIPGQGCAARRLAKMGVKLLDETNWDSLLQNPSKPVPQ